VIPPNGRFSIQLQPQDLKMLHDAEKNARRENVPAALNVPLGLLQLPYTILNPERQAWVPRGMFFETWRAVSWPLIGIMFWWAAGRGLEALVAARRGIIRPRISWPEMGIASLFFVIFGGVAIFLTFDRESMRSDPNSAILLAGCGLWAILAGVTIAARIAQWRIHVISKRTDLGTA
jgi:hypothetical protein